MIKKETLRMIKDRVTESINGLMEMYITVINIYIYIILYINIIEIYRRLDE